MEDKKKITASLIKQRLDSALQYKNSLGLHDKWRKFEKFKNGEQWAPPTPETKALPRPVFNIIDHIVNFKKSSVMSENVSLVYGYIDGYTNQDSEQDFATILSRYSETVWEEVFQDKLNSRALAQAAITGIGIWHYFWDSAFLGGDKLKYTGRIKGEVLNPINVYFGNPNNIEVQEQPWILILNRMMVDDIKKIAEESKIEKSQIELIKEDKPEFNQTNNGGMSEVQEAPKANLITMYYKENGVIYYCRSCGDVIVTKPTSTEFELYPMVIVNWKERQEAIYGTSEVEGIIPNQKALNLLLSLQLMNVQLTGFPRLVYKKGAIDPSKITNRIGEIIEDKSQTPGFQTQYLNAGQVSPLAGDLTTRFMNYTKDLSGANDNATGETKAENATAIMLLQKSAGTTLDDIRRNFHRSIHDIGMVWMEFFKHRYNTMRILSIVDQDNTKQFVQFDSSMIENMRFKLKINVGISSAYAESFTTTALDKFLAAGYITFEQYLKYSPKNTVPFKDALLRELEKEKERQVQGTEDELLAELPPEMQERYANMSEEEQQVFMLALAKNKEEKIKNGGPTGPGSPDGDVMLDEDMQHPEVAMKQKNDAKYQAMKNGEGMFRPSV